MRVQALWHYPVKSLLGEPVQQLSLDMRGAVGDRLHAVVTADGKLGSGKSTRRFARIDRLLSLRATGHPSALQITFPDGTTRRADAEDLNALLSRFLEQPVTLEQEQAVAHHDDSPVHLLLTSELSRLQALVPEARIDPRRFRANIVLQTPQHLTGEDLLGKVLTLGDTRLLITHKTERCRMVTLPQEDLPFEPRVLRAIAQDLDVDFGLYAKVLRPGSVSVGQQAATSTDRGSKRRRDAGDLGI